jgi:hypothetical protein
MANLVRVAAILERKQWSVFTNNVTLVSAHDCWWKKLSKPGGASRARNERLELTCACFVTAAGRRFFTAGLSYFAALSTPNLISIALEDVRILL